MQKYLRQVMSKQEIDLALSRIAAEILEDHPELDGLVLVGIRRRGVPLAEILQTKVKSFSGETLPMGTLDITFYRDDLSMIDTQPVVEASHLSFDVNGKNVLLVDDVLYTGRTTRAALDCVIQKGRPRKVELVVLIDRGHRELPIQADYVGKYVETAEDEVIEVRMPPVDRERAVFLTTVELIQRSNNAARETDSAG